MYILTKLARTNFELKATNILIVCWFLPACGAKTDSIVSFMQICTMVQKPAPNLTIVCVVHDHSVLKYAFLSGKMLKLLTMVISLNH